VLILCVGVLESDAMSGGADVLLLCVCVSVCVCDCYRALH